MKMKTLTTIIALWAVMLFTMIGCKKSADTETDFTTEFTAQAEDQAMVSTEDDAVSNDVNQILESDTTLAGRGTGILCDATLSSSSTATSRIVTITYNGTNCNGNRTRTGSITLSIPKGKNQGVELFSLKI